MQEPSEGPGKREDFARAAASGRRGIVREFWHLLRSSGHWSLVPILLALALLGAFLTLGGTGAAPFIYALF